MYSVCDGGKDHRERVSFALNAEPLSHSDSGNRVLLVCLTATLELLYGLLCYAVPHVLKSTVPLMNYHSILPVPSCPIPGYAYSSTLKYP